MSDDRFKQARRSLIDRNKQRQQEQDDGAPGDLRNDDFHEDEKTLMVNVDELEGSPPPPGRQPPSQPPPQPPSHGQPRRNSGGRGAPSRGPSSPRGNARGGGGGRQNDFADEATQMVDINEFGGGPGSPPAHVDENTEPHREALSPGPPGPPGVGGQQVFAPAGGSGHEGKTDFINISDFAQEGNEFAPDSNSAGYEGKTAFIQIDSLQGAQQQPSGPPQQVQGSIAGDQMLRQAYQFGPESIQHGEVTLIFAQNPLGRQVVLRRVWEGNHAQMPPDVRQRIAQLDTLEHPRLVKLNGVVATQTGLWADLQKPEGYRLSAVLQQHGPQDKENVFIWLEQIAEVLDAIHASELLYANLTPDAIWIQEDNSIMLEPFDLLSFEKRGDLGPFGPQELKRPPSDRVLSPATDVFSLAAIGAAAVTGLPFHAEKLANLEDQKLASKLQKGLATNPTERPQTATEFADQFQTGGFSFSFDQINFDPAELDIKVVAVIAVLLLGGFGGYMYWNQQQAKKAAQLRAQQAAIAQQQPPGEQGAPGGAAEGGPAAGGPAAGEQAAAGGATGEEDGAAQEESGAPVAPPGAIESDPRLNVVSSYQTNPPVEDTKTEMSGEEAEAEAKKLREAAQKRIDEAKNLRSSESRRDEYTAALEDVTTAIRLNGGKPTEEDQKILDDLTSKRLVREYRKDLRERIEKAIANGAISDARRSYKRLYTIDFRASAVDFFHHNNEASVRTISSKKEGDDDEDK